jgi:hypothetical protein
MRTQRAPIVHHELTGHCEAKPQLRISGGDSRKKPVLASDDATESRSP